MAKRKGVSGKTHTKQQLNDYANQNNPNNKAYRARRTNEEKARKTRNHFDQDMIYYEPDLGFGWCDDQDLRKAGICMGNFFYNLFNGKTGYTISDSMAVDEDGDLLMRLSDHTVMDMDTGEIGFLSSAGNLFDEEDEW